MTLIVWAIDVPHGFLQRETKIYVLVNLLKKILSADRILKLEFLK